MRPGYALVDYFCREGVRAPYRRILAQKSRRAFRAEEKLLRSQGAG